MVSEPSAPFGEATRRNRPRFCSSAMAVHSEALARLHSVVVDNPQGTEAHVGGIVVIGKRKRVRRIEPTVVESPSLSRFANLDHGCLLIDMQMIY
jgi:hypothetical protein